MARKNPSPASLDQYLHEIDQYELLTPDEEKHLGRRVAHGDAEARDRMVRSNLRLVVSTAREFTNRGLPLADLVAEGNMGLLKAVEKFDPEAGTRFSTYAIWWIRQAIRRAVQMDSSTVRVPGYMVELLSRWKRASEELAARHGRPPAPGEVAKHLNMPAKQVSVLRRAMHAASAALHPAPDMMWLFEGVLVDEKNKTPEALLFEENDHEMIQACLAAIDEREAEVLRLRYGLDTGQPMTLRDIGAHLGVTRERARQLETAAMRKLVRAVGRYQHGDREAPPEDANEKAPPKSPSAKPQNKA